jgi:aspartyl-tRNA(Asn)/glutamyl-tRNA(Gln) amidotransferase subunit C
LVSRDEVLRIARLAKLSLTREEESKLGHQLGRILGYVELLRELDVESPPAAGLDAPRPAAGRADVLVPGLNRAVVLAMAPAHDDETFLVPPMIDSGEGS